MTPTHSLAVAMLGLAALLAGCGGSTSTRTSRPGADAGKDVASDANGEATPPADAACGPLCDGALHCCDGYCSDGAPNQPGSTCMQTGDSCRVGIDCCSHICVGCGGPPGVCAPIP